MKLIAKHLLIIVTLCFAQVLWAQSDIEPDDTPLTVQEITEADLETYRNDKNFIYEERQKKETFIDRFFNWLGNVLQSILEFLFGEGNVGGILGFIFNVLPYLVLALLLYLLLRFFL